MYEQCPKCQSNNWSKLQTGNIENKTFFYNKFCNDCHKFSFSYKCTPSGENVEIEGIIIETEEYIVNVDYDKRQVFIEGIIRKKTDGTEKAVPIKPSNLMILELDSSDTKRIKKIKQEKVKEDGK